jgi:hypothetical protein
MAVDSILELVLQSASFMQKLQERALDNNTVFYKVYYLAAAISEFHHVQSMHI